MQTLSLKGSTLIRPQMSKVPGSEVSYPSKAFGQYDLAPTKDLCINCEKSNKIIGTITIDKKTGPICFKCFKSYQNK
jgi:hypothetical protein